MTSAADFTRQQRFNLPKDFPVTELSEHEQHMQASRRMRNGVILFGLICGALCGHMLIEDSRCKAKGLLAGAMNEYEVQTRAGVCLAKVNGKWIEVK